MKRNYFILIFLMWALIGCFCNSNFCYTLLLNHINITRWLHQGVALYKANFFSLERLKISFQGYADFPTIEQLDSIEKTDNQLFDQMNGFKISTLLIHFIDTQWGWTTLLNLLD